MSSSSSSSENGACLVVRTLLRGGVDTMFANPGTTEMLIVDALDRVVEEEKKMRGVLCLHETVCSGAADGYARMTGRPACTLLHLGVGLANASANLHNARRACAPIINLVGDMATWHVGADPLLASDIEGLAAFASCLVQAPRTPDAMPAAVAEALVAIRDYRCGESRVATLALPHDAQREAASLEEIRKVGSVLEDAKPVDEVDGLSLFEQSIKVHNEQFGGNDAIPNKVRACAEALKTASKAALVVGGAGVYDDRALKALDAIQRATSCALVVENAFARVDRGRGRPAWRRVPYFPGDAKSFFGKFDAIVFCGARKPVAMFGYDDNISQILPEAGVLEIDAMDVPGALQYLRDALADAALPPPPTTKRATSQQPTGRLNAAKLCQVLALAQPEGAIVVDESLTTGTAYWDLTATAPPFSHLTLTGGSIGIGPPLSVGCAVACPNRRVINFQADGSGLYSTPAFWTQAAEDLDITTIVCANQTYQILKVEQQKQKLSASTPNAKKLTTLGRVDWVSIAKGYGIEAISVATAEDLKTALEASFARKGPYLIEARL
ncbi:hypothetical protein CTAYLR_000481 [Chrysophaeum taylorii]|uniref:Acetolactate synthase large subunit n=1 Tax=Chrysophaeum taylorii TaxID=2483200 RepID=A0AAD7UIE0_9STRA|nr:hypothetical protein CTAYLR_000481 [Chrysophaeum taylorii]